MQQSTQGEDKLAIYKQQAAIISKRKDRNIEDLKRAEEQQKILEKETRQKDEQLQKIKGPGYKIKGDFNDYANNLKEKTTKYKKMNSELNSIRAEVTTLARTEAILKKKQEKIENTIKETEKR